MDIMRIVAVVAVIMIHTSGGYVITYDKGTPELFWGNIFDSIARIGVPLFVMISGSLMLDENKKVELKPLFFKNIKNIVGLIIVWSVIYAGVFQIISPLLNGKEIHLKKLLYAIIMGHFHMWYLYMLVGLYLITPFLRVIVKKENSHLVLLFIAIALMVQFTSPILNGLSVFFSQAKYIIEFINKFYLNFFCGYTVYYLTGWYLVHVGIRKRWIKNVLYSASILSLLLTMLYVQYTKDFSDAYSNQNLFVFIYSVGVFQAFNNMKLHLSERTAKLVILLSKLSFGVYIIHPLLQKILFKILPFPDAPAICILWKLGTVSVLAFVICYIMSKIPIIKRVIRA